MKPYLHEHVFVLMWITIYKQFPVITHCSFLFLFESKFISDMRPFSFPVKYVKYFFLIIWNTKSLGLKTFKVHPKWNATNKQNQWVHNFGITSIYLSMTRARFHLLFNPYKECKYMYTYRLWSLKYTNT